MFGVSTVKSINLESASIHATLVDYAYPLLGSFPSWARNCLRSILKAESPSARRESAPY